MYGLVNNYIFLIIFIAYRAHCKRILFEMDNVPVDKQTIIKTIYPLSILEEISCRDAKEFIEKCYSSCEETRSGRFTDQ